MSRKSVAVLDIRSSEISVMIGERSVNDTFVFQAFETRTYDGYNATGMFFDEDKLSQEIRSAIGAVEAVDGRKIKELYVGVPDLFCEVVCRDKAISFPKKRKIRQQEIDDLFASGNEPLEGYRFIRASAMIFTTADNRRVVNPMGISSSMLSGSLSYFYCSEYFAQFFENLFESMEIAVRFLPTELAMANYLIASETRDEYALFLDVGDLTSSAMALFGNGVVMKKSFWYGRGQIAAYISQNLTVTSMKNQEETVKKLPYEAALALLTKINLFSKFDGTPMEFDFHDETLVISPKEFVEEVKAGLCFICEEAYGLLQNCTDKDMDCKPLYVTGEGLYGIRGALEYVGTRLGRVCEQLAPDLPYYNKPTMSSRIALTAMAYDDDRKRGFLSRLLAKFGG